MNTFNTEFPVSTAFDRARFVNLVVDWVAGIKASSLVRERIGEITHDDEVELTGPNAEKLIMKHVVDEDGFIAGAKHSICDNEAREWRTEIVLSNIKGRAFVKVRGQCLGAAEGVPTPRPKKPFLIKKILEEGWGALDGLLEVQPTPHYFGDKDVELACELIQGVGSSSLPIVYVSRNQVDDLNVNAAKLAFDLGGLAHVVVEPSVEFSYRLSEMCGRKNPFAGNVGVCVQSRGVLKNLFLGGSLPSSKDLASAIKETVEILVSNRSTLGAPDWLELQDLHAKRLRARLISIASGGESELEHWLIEFQGEIDGYKQKIRELERELAARDEKNALSMFATDGLLQSGLIAEAGVELYEGEFSDRVRAGVIRILEISPELDQRTLNFYKRFIAVTSFTGRAEKLNTELKQAGRAGRKFGILMREILNRHKYIASEDGPHIKMNPPSDAIGGPVITLPKTPSDSAHGGGNQASDIAKILGLKRLF